MQRLGHRFDASDQSARRARNVAIGVERKDPPISYSGNRVPLVRKRQRHIFIAGLIGNVTAGRNEDDLRRGVHDFLQAYAARRRSYLAQHVYSTGMLHHFRNPVASDVKRL